MNKPRGQLIAIVGPSGVGKDTVMERLKEKRSDIVLARRTITRPEDAGGENFIGVTETEFEALKGDGAFVLDWQAHGLCYGIPQTIDDELAEGKTVIFNGSRGALPDAMAKYPDMKVIVILASPDILAKRLKARGRESEEEIKKRLKRAEYKSPEGDNIFPIYNDGALEDTVSELEGVIFPQVENVQ